MAYNYNTVVFVETAHFSHLVKEYFNDEEYREMQYYLMEHPEAGKIITGSGGIRKLRRARQGMGKSGGVRVIYYWAKARDQIYMLTMYSKSERESIDTKTLARIAKSLEAIK
jgi:hypothetical protein